MAYQQRTITGSCVDDYADLIEDLVDWSVKLQASTRIVMLARILDSRLDDSSRHPSSNSQLGTYSTHCITQLLRSWSADRSVSARLSG